jgi:hypothetical protein
MDNVKLYTWLVFVLLLLSPFILQPWIEAHAHRDLAIEKHGHLVMADTSEPLAGALVVFHWRKLHRSSDCLVQRATTTDADGAFVFPDVSREVSFDRTWAEAIIGTITAVGYYTATYDYTLTVYAPGYALVDPRHATSRPPGLAYALAVPSGREVEGVLQLDPIKVTSTSFSTADEIAYLARLKREFDCPWLRQSQLVEVKEASANLTDHLRLLPCAMPPETIMPAALVTEYLLATNDKRLMKSLAPPGAKLGPPSWQRELTAGAVCQAASG